MGFEDLPCHPKGIVKLPGTGAGKEAELTHEGQHCHAKNVFQKNKQTKSPENVLFLFNYLKRFVF